MKGAQHATSVAGGLLLVLILVSPITGVGADGHDAAPAYLEERHFVGVIGCSAGLAPLQTADYCAKELPIFGQLDQNAYSSHEFPMAEGLTGLVIYFDVANGFLGPTAVELSWLVPVGAIAPLSGYGPFLATYTFDAESDPWTTVAVDAQFGVRADPHQPTPQVSYQQRYDVCLGLFYNGLPIPDDYHPCPDA